MSFCTYCGHRAPLGRGKYFCTEGCGDKRLGKKWCDECGASLQALKQEAEATHPAEDGPGNPQRAGNRASDEEEYTQNWRTTSHETLRTEVMDVFRDFMKKPQYRWMVARDHKVQRLIETREIGICDRPVIVTTGGVPVRSIYRAARLSEEEEIVRAEEAVRKHCQGEATTAYEHIAMVDTYEKHWYTPVAATPYGEQIIVVVRDSITLKNRKGECRVIEENEAVVIPKIGPKVPAEDRAFTWRVYS
jgi:hypothetical protein